MPTQLIASVAAAVAITSGTAGLIAKADHDTRAKEVAAVQQAADKRTAEKMAAEYAAEQKAAKAAAAKKAAAEKAAKEAAEKAKAEADRKARQDAAEKAAPSSVPDKPKPAIRTAEPKAPTAPLPERQAPPVEKMPKAETGGGMSDAKREIMMRESGGNANAVNSSSGTVGAFQCHPSFHQCPALGDLAGQSAWADNYVSERYGSWDAALQFHNAHGSY